MIKIARLPFYSKISKTSSLEFEMSMSAMQMTEILFDMNNLGCQVSLIESRIQTLRFGRGGVGGSGGGGFKPKMCGGSVISIKIFRSLNINKK